MIEPATPAFNDSPLPNFLIVIIWFILLRFSFDIPFDSLPIMRTNLSGFVKELISKPSLLAQ